MRLKLIVKMYLLFSLTMVVGFLFFSWTISQNYAQTTVELQKQYEREIISKRGSEINERLTHIGSVFSNAYLPDDQGNSVVSEFAENYENIDETLIDLFLESVIRSNIYINDILIIDLKSDTVYSRSKRFIKRFYQDYDWKNDPFIQEVSQGSGIQMRGLHESYGSNVNEEVYSFAHNIQNQEVIDSGEQYAVILVNVRPHDLFTTSSIGTSNYNENFIVVDAEGETLYQEFSHETISRDSYENNPSYEISQMALLSWSGLSCLNIIDTIAIYENSLKTILQGTLPIMAIILLFCLLITAISTRLFSRRINRIVHHMSKLETGNFSETLKSVSDDELSIIENGLNKMTERLQSHIKKEYISTLKIAQARLQSLQVQINPHFMFNTLETIRSTASLEKATKTSRMITLLGQMYRWNLRNKDSVTIKDELEYIEEYLSLFEINKGIDIELNIQMPLEHYQILIPKLSLQPIVENSLIHGCEHLEESYAISISTEDISDSVIGILITDEGKGISNKQAQELEKNINSTMIDDANYHIGLANVHNRIKLKYGETFGVKILQLEHIKGASIQILLPKKMTENENI